VNGDDPKNIVAIAKNLQSEINKNKKAEFKAMIVVLGDKAALKPVVKAAATEANTPDVAMAILPKTDEAVKNYKINLAADVKNTVFVYRNWKVSDSMVNLKADTKGLNALNAAIAKAVAM
jgi:F420-0:gamma-glutamyl ligase-like protein